MENSIVACVDRLRHPRVTNLHGWLWLEFCVCGEVYRCLPLALKHGTVVIALKHVWDATNFTSRSTKNLPPKCTGAMFEISTPHLPSTSLFFPEPCYIKVQVFWGIIGHQVWQGVGGYLVTSIITHFIQEVGNSYLYHLR